MTPLLHAHSGTRYLVFLAGLIAIGYLAFALATGRSAGKATRVLGAVFSGLFDLQLLLGLALVAMGRFYPAMWGHLSLMILAAVQLHALLVMNRKRAVPGQVLPLVAITAALVLAVAGIFAIGRNPLTMAVA